MFFNIDGDHGEAIFGWFAPDNPSVTPRIAVLVPGRDEIEIEANIRRSDVQELGIHGTGMVGFSIDRSIISDLDRLDDIELVDAATRMPIYRRHHIERHLERKVFIFDSALMPQRRILESARNVFTLNYPNAERYSLETLIVLISNNFSKSIFMSGRSNLSRYNHYLENNGFLRAALLRDPFEELAERLMFLCLLANSNTPEMLMHFVSGLTPLIDFAKDFPFNDSKEMLSAFRKITDEQRNALISPMVRMLGCNVDEIPERRHVSIALDNLSQLEIVGTRSRYPAFSALLKQTLGVDILGPHSPARFKTVESVTHSLARIGIVADILEYDLALYSFAEEAIASGLSGVTTDLEDKRLTQVV